MKTTVFLFSIFLALSANAITWKVYGPCDDKPVVQGEVAIDLAKSVGDITVQILEANKIPYIGSAEGFNSIISTPTGIDSVEVVSDTELRAYGWCYTVNGKQPAEMPHKVNFGKQTDALIWYYAYSTNKNNEWLDDYCSPAYWIKADQFCKK
ncbi:DUF4430 domain-containing protein [Bdellovibrio sp. 22V]|uniref:DUF4430 domain-containing protein n=1 Tax=Bdellovibrio TaxID=958 RepID=UPI002543B6A3|nr:DUF4430 domain-containing protein [Bdellovibrio sp. 22V]WII70577.1 DUF4430 domain-containing protein [Bdellovibrio sp. 22V]